MYLLNYKFWLIKVMVRMKIKNLNIPMIDIFRERRLKVVNESSKGNIKIEIKFINRNVKREKKTLILTKDDANGRK